MFPLHPVVVSEAAGAGWALGAAEGPSSLGAAGAAGSSGPAAEGNGEDEEQQPRVHHVLREVGLRQRLVDEGLLAQIWFLYLNIDILIPQPRFSSPFTLIVLYLWGFRHCRRRGGGRGKHRVWLHGLWRAEYCTLGRGPQLLQLGQVLAMTAVTQGLLGGGGKPFQTTRQQWMRGKSGHCTQLNTCFYRRLFFFFGFLSKQVQANNVINCTKLGWMLQHE